MSKKVHIQQNCCWRQHFMGLFERFFKDFFVSLGNFPPTYRKMIFLVWSFPKVVFVWQHNVWIVRMVQMLSNGAKFKKSHSSAADLHNNAEWSLHIKKIAFVAFWFQFVVQFFSIYFVIFSAPQFPLQTCGNLPCVACSSLVGRRFTCGRWSSSWIFWSRGIFNPLLLLYRRCIPEVWELYPTDMWTQSC